MSRHRRFEKNRNTHGFLGFFGNVLKGIGLRVIYVFTFLVMFSGLFDLIMGNRTPTNILLFVVGGMGILLLQYKFRGNI
jgi:hypothetical protein